MNFLKAMIIPIIFLSATVAVAQEKVPFPPAAKCTAEWGHEVYKMKNGDEEIGTPGRIGTVPVDERGISLEPGTLPLGSVIIPVPGLKGSQSEKEQLYSNFENTKKRMGTQPYVIDPAKDKKQNECISKQEKELDLALTKIYPATQGKSVEDISLGQFLFEKWEVGYGGFIQLTDNRKGIMDDSKLSYIGFINEEHHTYTGQCLAPTENKSDMYTKWDSFGSFQFKLRLRYLVATPYLDKSGQCFVNDAAGIRKLLLKWRDDDAQNQRTAVETSSAP